MAFCSVSLFLFSPLQVIGMYGKEAIATDLTKAQHVAKDSAGKGAHSTRDNLAALQPLLQNLQHLPFVESSLAASEVPDSFVSVIDHFAMILGSQLRAWSPVAGTNFIGSRVVVKGIATFMVLRGSDTLCLPRRHFTFHDELLSCYQLQMKSTPSKLPPQIRTHEFSFKELSKRIGRSVDSCTKYIQCVFHLLADRASDGHQVRLDLPTVGVLKISHKIASFEWNLNSDYLEPTELRPSTPIEVVDVSSSRPVSRSSVADSIRPSTAQSRASVPCQIVKGRPAIPPVPVFTGKFAEAKNRAHRVNEEYDRIEAELIERIQNDYGPRLGINAQRTSTPSTMFTSGRGSADGHRSTADDSTPKGVQLAMEGACVRVHQSSARLASEEVKREERSRQQQDAAQRAALAEKLTLRQRAKELLEIQVQQMEAQKSQQRSLTPSITRGAVSTTLGEGSGASITQVGRQQDGKREEKRMSQARLAVALSEQMNFLQRRQHQQKVEDVRASKSMLQENQKAMLQEASDLQQRNCANRVQLTSAWAQQIALKHATSSV